MSTDTLFENDGFGSLPTMSRIVLLMGVVALHALAIWGLLSLVIEPAIEKERPPVEVQWITDGRIEPPAAQPQAKPSPTTEPIKQPIQPKVVREQVIAAKNTTPIAEKFTAPEPVIREETRPQPAAQASTAAQPAQQPASTGNGQPRSVGISAIRYKSKPNAEYPEISKEMGEYGVVSIRVVIGTDGRVQSAQVSKSSGFRRLDDAALRAVRRASFYPYLENGVAVPAAVNIPFNFNFKKPAARSKEEQPAKTESGKDNTESARADES